MLVLPLKQTTEYRKQWTGFIEIHRNRMPRTRALLPFWVSVEQQETTIINKKEVRGSCLVSYEKYNVIPKWMLVIKDI